MAEAYSDNHCCTYGASHNVKPIDNRIPITAIMPSIRNPKSLPAEREAPLDQPCNKEAATISSSIIVMPFNSFRLSSQFCSTYRFPLYYDAGAVLFSCACSTNVRIVSLSSFHSPSEMPRKVTSTLSDCVLPLISTLGLVIVNAPSCPLTYVALEASLSIMLVASFFNVSIVLDCTSVTVCLI
ncbi:hypothetical protein D3C74_317830 [compost metagenome]